jgi:hypothetical protein
LIIQINFTSDRKFDIASFAIPFLNFFDRSPIPSVSSIGTKYCVSNDLRLFLLIVDDPSLYNEININPQILSFNGKCVIPGHPRRLLNSYIYPASYQKNESIITSKFNQTFITLNINSEEVIHGKNGNILELKASTTSGMSGSPVFKINESKLSPSYRNYEFLGVYVGGPLILGQHEILEITRSCINTRNRNSALKDFNLIKSFLPSTFATKKLL